MKCLCCLKTLITPSSFAEAEAKLYEKLVQHKPLPDGHICEMCKNQFQEISAIIEKCRENFEYFANETDILRAEIVFEDQQISDNEYSYIEILDAGDDKTIQKSVKYIDCTECKKQFTSNRQLNIHLKTHLPVDERPYSCSACTLKFSQKSALTCHERIHKQEKPYVCSFCGRKFTQKTTLKTHITGLHTGKQIQCDKCDKKFSRKSFLLVHQRLHAGIIKMYSCDNCEKEYKQKSHLRRHIECTHLNIRHTCEICQKSFSKSWTLKIHSFVHNQHNLPYKCSAPGCPMSFQRRDYLLKHVSKVHPEAKLIIDPFQII